MLFAAKFRNKKAVARTNRGRNWNAPRVASLNSDTTFSSPFSFPFTFFYHAIEHGIYGLTHLVDLPLCAVYGPAELLPGGPKIEPLDIYQGTWFDSSSSTDAESGELISSGN